MDIDIVKIGNSQGIRIPKSVLKQVGLQNKARLIVENGTLVIVPKDELTNREMALLSEGSLSKIWNDPREDEAWKHLQ